MNIDNLNKKFIGFKKLKGARLLASDGKFGRLSEFFFKDDTWAIKYLVVENLQWLILRHKYLLSPIEISDVSVAGELFTFHTKLTKKQIENTPTVDSDKPYVMQQRILRQEHYGSEVYYGAEAGLGYTDETAFEPKAAVNETGKPFDRHLRTTRIVLGYEVETRDGEELEVDDFIIDVRTWQIPFIVVRKGADRALLSTKKVKIIRFEESEIEVDDSFDQMKKYEQFTEVLGRPD